jgi:hypothetical protein
MSDAQTDPFAFTRSREPEGGTDDIATYAAMEFEPLSAEDREGAIAALSQPKWGETTLNLGIALRLAITVMEKSKPELVNIARNMGEDLASEFMDHLQEAEGLFRAYLWLAQTALNRQLSACAVVVMEGDQ